MRKAAKKQSTSRVTFKVLRLNDVIYNLGDTVRIKEEHDEDSYGTVLKFWKKSGESEAFVRVRWFFKPKDVLRPLEDFISQGELFDSDLEQDIWVQSIYGKVTVKSLEDYHQLDEIEEDIYFCRAVYRHKERVLDPPYMEWKRVCYCKNILNPDHLYFVCEGCNGLFHVHCVGVIDQRKLFYCSKCFN